MNITAIHLRARELRLAAQRFEKLAAAASDPDGESPLRRSLELDIILAQLQAIHSEMGTPAPYPAGKREG